MQKLVCQGNTLYIYAKKGFSIRIPGFYKVDEMILRSNSIFGKEIAINYGLHRYTFGRIKNVILIPVYEQCN